MSKVRILFLGTPEFAAESLRVLLADDHFEVAGVVTQPDRPAGRKMRTQPSAVKQVAEAAGLRVFSPSTVYTPEFRAEVAALKCEAGAVVAFGQILGQKFLDLFPHGCVNVHGSLLPRWRGAAPIQAAVLAGDTETGITIMQMDPGLDTGAMLLQGRVPIGPRTTAAGLHDSLAGLGADLVLRALQHPLTAVPQPQDGATYAAKLTRDSGRLDWTQPAAQLDRQVRGLTPWPGTWAMLGSEVLKVLRAEPAAGAGPPGTILDNALLVACGEGALRLLRVQRPGRAPMDAEALLRGFAIPPGTCLV